MDAEFELVAHSGTAPTSKSTSMWSSWRGWFQSRAAINCPTINTSLPIYVQTIIDGLRIQPNSFAQGDLDWTNILVTDKKVGAIIDWESSGYFPAYSEWEALDGLQTHKSQTHGPNSWQAG